MEEIGVSIPGFRIRTTRKGGSYSEKRELAEGLCSMRM